MNLIVVKIMENLPLDSLQWDLPPVHRWIQKLKYDWTKVGILTTSLVVILRSYPNLHVDTDF